MNYDELFGGGDDVDLAGGLDFPPAADASNINLDFLDVNSPVGSGLFDAAGNINLENIGVLTTNPELFALFAEANPEDAEILRTFLGGQARDIDDASISEGVINTGDPDGSYKTAETKKFARQTEGVPVGDPDDPMGIKKLADISGDGKLNLSDLLKYGLPALGAYASYKSAKDAQKQAAGAKFESRAPVKATKVGGRGVKYSAQGGGIGSLDMAQGGRALPPRYLDGHSDGMADKVPAHIDGKRPAALSDGEFVIPADVVSHLGNGNSNAGAKRLYEMMDRIRSARTGNHKQGKQINPDKFIPR